MPRTRNGAESNTDAQQIDNAHADKRQPLRPSSPAGNQQAEPPRGKKRQSTDNKEKGASQKDERPRKSAKTKSSPKSAQSPTKNKEDPPSKPRLTTPDLEYDYDKSQMRDPRPTPGRMNRPRYEERHLSEEWLSQFYIPKPIKPKGRLNAVQKEDLFEEEIRLDPSKTFHDLYVCYGKGPRGSPTYDSAGFQLDWHKVDDWMRPKAYNKRRMMKGMDRAVDKAQKEEKEMFDIFFRGDTRPDKSMGINVKNYLKDHVSKDLGIPWHQIETEQVREWEKRGFEKVDYNDWWREPTKEESERMANMMSGSSLRRDL